jgi:hypothetical protein
MLPNMGISRKTHRSVIFSTAQLGGLGPQPFAIFNGPPPLQKHHRQANELNARLYTTRMRLYGKCTGTRLRKVFTGFHDGKLGYRNLGTLALL